MQRAVELRFQDTSTLAREAAVDLVGRFVLSRPELTSQYYGMICERIRVSSFLYLLSSFLYLFEQCHYDKATFSYILFLNTCWDIVYYYSWTSG